MKKMKIIFIANVYKHLITFHIPYMNDLKKKGYEVICIAKENKEDEKILLDQGFSCVNVPFDRNPRSIENLKAYVILFKYLKNNSIKLIHTHTPIAAFVTRAAARKRNIKMVYTAHGFHFFKGAPIKNWVIYYPLEKLALKWTDMLITINQEDYKRAIKMNVPADRLSFVHGVGVEVDQCKISEEDFLLMKENLGIPLDSLVISYVAEFNENKNQFFMLKNWRMIKEKNPKAVLLFIGEGVLKKDMEEFVEKENLKGIYFLGYRNDVSKILKITNIVSLLSYREGLPKSIMEAMTEGIPCIVSDTRGLRDLVEHKKNGYIIKHDDDLSLVRYISEILERPEIRKNMSLISSENIKPYLYTNVVKEYSEIYSKLLLDEYK